MSNQMLILFAIFADRAHQVGLAEGAAQVCDFDAKSVCGWLIKNMFFFIIIFILFVDEK